MGRSTVILIVLLILVVGGLFFFNSQADPVPLETIEEPVVVAEEESDG
ncbi:hypothetical protein [Sphingomicrobium clamense]|uniref:Uncharacterized protein n=1 Tax=Sphingomicrobium clamense TaxID=2851013 RepID=A0ABS6V8V4_9SPHN|nr:hypothetical protein [Sphingomicrobium sp. B8]MBW0145508.1 hypothetical protein [Sphingomicrobium sp. B8]